MMYEEEFDRLLEEQIRTAKGQRLEMLRKDKTGEKKLFCEVVRPVLPTVKDLIMEYEITSLTGAKIYLDFYLPYLRWAIECEGFVPHAEKITRDRFDFERVRVRTMKAYRIDFIPFTWDELRSKPEMCRRSLYELLGRQSVLPGAAYEELTIFEREIIRYAIYLNRFFNMEDVTYCTGLKKDAGRKILRGMIDKGLILPTGGGQRRFHEFTLLDKSRNYLI